MSVQANGITLTFIEKSGLIQTAENLGLLSAVSDRCAYAVTYPLPRLWGHRRGLFSLCARLTVAVVVSFYAWEGKQSMPKHLSFNRRQT